MPSLEEINQDEDHLKGVDIVLHRPGSQASTGRSSSSSQCSDRLETFSKLGLETPRLPQERPNVFHPPHSTYTPPMVSLPVGDAVTSQQSVVSPVTYSQPPIIFSPPFCQTYGVGDQIYPAASYQAASGASVPSESFVGAFADKLQNVDPGYGFLHSPSLMVNPPRSGARSPLPTSGPRHPAYTPEPFQAMSNIPFPLNRSPSGSDSVASVGPLFHNQPEAFAGYRLSVSRENLAANMPLFELPLNSALQPGAPLSCPGSGCSSRSGSVVGEDSTYIQCK